MNAPVKANYWNNEIAGTYSPVQRLCHEVRIAGELRRLSMETGDDYTGMDEYQWLRVNAALEEVTAELESKS